jgi:hypothetical protein
MSALSTIIQERTANRHERDPGAGLWVVALAIPTIMFAIVVTRFFSFTNDQPEQSRFYENQAVSLLHGHVDVPLQAIGSEAFELHGRYYGYFGPTPAILRLPVMVFFSAGDPLKQPFLAPIYMTFAFLLAGLAIAGITSNVGLKGWLAPGFTFITLTGSALMLLSARALVYEEAVLWGASFALVSILAALHLLESPSKRWAIVAISAPALALLARPAAGIGAVAVVFAVVLIRRAWWVLAGVLIASISLYSAFMLWKFGAFEPPFTHQLDCSMNPKCMAVARDSFGPQYIPTNVVQYFRPDLLRFAGHFPWIVAPSPKDAPVKLIGVNNYFGTEQMSSVTLTMPLLLLLSFVGIAVTSWSRRWLIIASCAGPVATCMWVGATQRYLADFVPTLILAGAYGVGYLRTLKWRPAFSIVIVTLGTWSVLFCMALAVSNNWISP